MRQHERRRHRHHPHIAGIEQECDPGLSAGAQRKIGCICIRINGHADSADADQPGSDPADLITRIVDFREEAAGYEKTCADPHTDQYGKDGQLDGFFFCAFYVSRAEDLPEDDGDGIAHGNEGNIEHIVECLGNIVRRHGRQPAHRVTLREHGHTAGPERFIHKKRKCFDCDPPGQRSRHLEQPPPCADDEPVASGIPVRPSGNIDQFHKAGQDCGRRSAGHAKRRRADLSVDQDIIAGQIDRHSEQPGFHRDNGLAGVSECCRISLRQRERQHSDIHHREVILCIGKCRLNISSAAVFREIVRDQAVAEQQKDHCAERCQQERQDHLHAEGVTHAFRIIFPVKLCSKDAYAGEAAEDAQVENEHELVEDGDAGHGICAETADHDIVEHVHEIRDALLDHDGNCDRQNFPVEIPVAEIFAAHILCSVN